MSQDSTIRVAVVGTGAIALEQHIPAWQSFADAEVVALADVDRRRLDMVAHDCGVERTESDYRRLLDDPLIDVVDICLPSGLHAEATVAALDAGKHVLCEKPLATKLIDAVKVLEAARSSNGKVMVAQHLRYDPLVRSLCSRLEEHSLGEVYYARTQWLRRRRLPAKASFTQRSLSGGGALLDLGVHMLDLAWWLMGCPTPLAVTGTTCNHLARSGNVQGEWGDWDSSQIDVEDFAAGIVRFQDNRLLAIEVSWLAFQPEPEFWRVQLFGTTGGLVWPDAVISGQTGRVPWDLRLSPTGGKKAHHAVVHAFAEAVRDDAAIPIPIEQSAVTVAVLEALYRSSASGREEPVELPGKSAN